MSASQSRQSRASFCNDPIFQASFKYHIGDLFGSSNNFGALVALVDVVLADGRMSIFALRKLVPKAEVHHGERERVGPRGCYLLTICSTYEFAIVICLGVVVKQLRE